MACLRIACPVRRNGADRQGDERELGDDVHAENDDDDSGDHVQHEDPRARRD